MRSVFKSRVFAACVASTITAVVVGGVAWSVQSPVDGGGVIHACYNPSSGAIHLDVKGACPSKGRSTPISWPSSSSSRGPGEQIITILQNTSGIPAIGCGTPWTAFGLVACNEPASRGDLAVTVDRDRYGTEARFFFEASTLVATGKSFCVRLFDDTAGVAVPGSEICGTSSDPNNALFVHQRVPISLGTGSHTLVVEGQPDTGFLFTGRLVVQSP